MDLRAAMQGSLLAALAHHADRGHATDKKEAGTKPASEGRKAVRGDDRPFEFCAHPAAGGAIGGLRPGRHKPENDDPVDWFRRVRIFFGNGEFFCEADFRASWNEA
jgi:hypothetical protein